MTNAKVSTRYVLSLLYEGEGILDRMVDGAHQLQNDTEDLLQSINRMCPTVRGEICTDLRDSQTCNVTGIFSEDGGEALETLIDFFNSNRTISYQLAGAQSGFTDLINQIEATEEAISNVNWALYLAVAFAIPLSLLCLWIVIAMFCKTDSTKMKYFQSGCIIPSIALFAILSYAFTGIFIFSSMAVSDVCIDDPDARMLAIAEHHYSQLSPFIYQFIQLYMTRK
jgi:hypothetical protein